MSAITAAPYPPLTSAVYLPIEEGKRELDARLILAGYLLQRGVTVVIGQQWLFGHNFMKLPRGVILLKSFNNIPAEHAAVFTKNGFICIALDEEALGLSDIDYMARDISPVIGRVCEDLLCQGLTHREATLRKIGRSFNILSIVGNARADLLDRRFMAVFEEEVEALRQDLGRFVLFNTNLGFAHNSWTPKQYEQLLLRTGWLAGDLSKDTLYADLVKRDDGNRQLTIDVVQGFARRNPDRRIIVRPHPMERPDGWSGLFDDLENVVVQRGGNHLAMLLASDLLLHTGCTTGLEARLMNRPAIAIRSDANADDPWRLFISYAVNPVAVGADHAIGLAEGHLSGAEPIDISAFGEESLGRHLARDSKHLASEKVADRLLDCFTRRGITPQAFDWHQALHAPIDRVIGRAEIDRRKFDVGPGEFQARMRRIFACLDGEVGASVQTVGEGLFLLSPE